MDITDRQLTGIARAVHLTVNGRECTLAAADPRSPLHQADPDSLTAHDGQLEDPDGRGDPVGEVLRRASLMTMDVISEWDPASGLAAAVGTEAQIPVRPGSTFS